jgi:hypothetical protein
VVIEKNIGAIFKTENVIEYKSPEDKITVEDFYKVYGYACFHASQKQVDVREVTLTFVETRHPQKLIKHLREERKYAVEERESGIYWVSGDIMPIQIIESKKLTRAGNLWLRDLSVGLRGQDVSVVLEESRLVRDDMRVDAYVYAILQANAEAVKEMKDMANVTLEQVLEDRGLIAKWKARGAQEVEQKWEATQQKWEATQQKWEATQQKWEVERRDLERQKQEVERQKQELERKLRQYESAT